MMAQARAIARAILPSPARRALRQLQARWRMVSIYGGLRRSPLHALRYVVVGRELDNFTYDIANNADLAGFLAGAYDVEPELAARYIEELRNDEDLERALRARLAHRSDRNDRMPFGRRLGWYAAARIRRPSLIIETGVHDGLGSIALLRALERNTAEGAPGRLIGFDINPEAGWLIPDALRTSYTLVIGDALARLPEIMGVERVGLFLHDSDHRYEHETAELTAIIGHMEDGGTLISDNAHSSAAFADFCSRHGLDARLWREEPRDHFYPGAGIGLAVVPMTGPVA